MERSRGGKEKIEWAIEGRCGSEPCVGRRAEMLLISLLKNEVVQGIRFSFTSLTHTMYYSSFFLFLQHSIYFFHQLCSYSFSFRHQSSFHLISFFFFFFLLCVPSSLFPHCSYFSFFYIFLLSLLQMSLFFISVLSLCDSASPHTLHLSTFFLLCFSCV